jgi:hypothetical protein
MGITVWTLCQWIWIVFCYPEQVDGNHCLLCWTGCVGIMWCYAEQLAENHGVNAVPVGWIMVSYAKSVVVNHVVLLCASRCDSRWVFLNQWLWHIVSYACVMLNRVCGNHGVFYWTSGWESRCECCASGCESWWSLLNQCLWIMVRYAEPVVVNHGDVCWTSGLWIIVCYAVPVVVKHCELYWASGCETLWVILSEWLRITLCYDEPGVYESLYDMLSQWLCIIVCYTELGVWESCVMLSQWQGIMVWMMCQLVWFMVSYAKRVVVNHGESCCASGCESWWCMLNQWFVNHGVLCCASRREALWIILSQLLVLKHCELYWASGCESYCAMLNRVYMNHCMICWASGCASLCAILS